MSANEIAAFEVKLLETVIQSRATDIHIEPRGKGWEIRLRLQGILTHYDELSQDEGLSLIQRFKVKANMNIGEKRLPQDGSFIYSDSSNEQYDLRISSLPTIEGEKLAIRMLYRIPEFSNIKQLGLNELDYEEVLKWISEPMGLYLITGPTGSGKTTSLYAIIQHLNHQHVNIYSIEDPVEIRLNGINQVQVNEVAGLTFANGLRSLLRQDPDIIMIGEVRDRETAEIAVRASLTGHLVFATLHANDAASAITRLLEMGIEPYLVSSALKGVIAQRMFTHICPQCSSSTTNSCSLCDGKRVLKRAPIFELMKIHEELSPYILERRPPSEIRMLSREINLQLTMPI